MENRVKIRKVNVLSLVNALVQVYNIGVNWVDIYGETNDEQDIVGLLFRKEYVAEEAKDNFETITDQNTEKKIELTDDDINQLL